MEGTAQYDSELVEALEENKRLKRELKIAKEEHANKPNNRKGENLLGFALIKGSRYIRRIH